ncbi:hypothetical protein Tco_1276080 [Tanacetum coccineum]
MLAPSGGGLILYQSYSKLYAMTGRKSHLLEDKQIPSVGVFDEVFSIWIDILAGNTRDLGSFGEETDKIMNQHQDSSRFYVQRLETVSYHLNNEAVTLILVTASQHFLTALYAAPTQLGSRRFTL